MSNHPLSRPTSLEIDPFAVEAARLEAENRRLRAKLGHYPEQGADEIPEPARFVYLEVADRRPSITCQGIEARTIPRPDLSGQ